MTAGAGIRTFVDTNILVHASRPGSSSHQRTVEALAGIEAKGDEPCLSRQVLREYLAATTRPQPGAVALAPAIAVADVRRFREIYTVLEDGPEVTERLLELLLHVATGGKQVHDANVVATMLAHGVTRLLTFNIADFRRFENLIEVAVP